MNRLMLVDDEENVLHALRRLIARSESLPPIQLECFSDPRAAMKRLTEAPFDVVLSDYRMPYADGVAVLEAALAAQPDCVRLILSAQADMDALIRAINDAGIFRFVAKPWRDRTLIDTLAEALRLRTQRREERELADAQRVSEGVLSEEEHALRMLEREVPGITQVRWGPNGEVLLDDE